MVNILQPEPVIPNVNEVSDDELDFEGTELIVTREDVVVEQVMEEDVSYDTASISGRKISDDVEISNEVSSPQKETPYQVNDEHSYGMSKSPRRLKKRIDDLVDKVECLTKKVKLCQQKAGRLARKVDTLTSVVDDLKANNLVSSGCAELLESTFSAVPRELMKRLVSQKASKNPGAYPPELRAFAMTLKFYSTKAYNYVRESFDLGLPHVSVIRRWCSSVDGEPGFTKDALTAMKAKVLAAKRDARKLSAQ